MTVMFTHVQAASERLRGHSHVTPIMTSRALNERAGAEVFLKCENFQRGGAFKFRGAFNAMSKLSDEQKARGAVTYSSGNHAQALALVGRALGVRTTIVMPEGAPVTKLEATRGYGAKVVLYDPSETTRESVAGALQRETNAVLVPPFDHEGVIAGQGTAALEMFEKLGHLDLLLVPCGGGGLLSGSAVVSKHLDASCRVVGVEPALGDDATRSFYTRTLQRVDNPPTIADGTRTAPWVG